MATPLGVWTIARKAAVERALEGPRADVLFLLRPASINQPINPIRLLVVLSNRALVDEANQMQHVV